MNRLHFMNAYVSVVSSVSSGWQQTRPKVHRSLLLLQPAVLYKKGPANAKGNAQQRCIFERPVKQNQSPDGARRPAANYLYHQRA